MRHAIVVIGSEGRHSNAEPELRLQGDDKVHVSVWHARAGSAGRLLDDQHSLVVRLLLAPLLAYRFYVHVRNTKLWSGKRPLILVYGRSLASRVAAYAGDWGGGDVVKADLSDEAPLGPTRLVLNREGCLEFRAD